MLDQVLIDGVDSLVHEIKGRLIERLEIGELEHKGQWHTKTIEELKTDIEEELLDALIYMMFIGLKNDS